VMLAMGLLYIPFTLLRYDLSISNLLRDFIMKDVKFNQKLFLHLLRWLDDFCPSFCLCDVLHLLSCMCWTIIASPEWNSLDCSVWYFWCAVAFDLLVFCWGFCIYVHQGYWFIVSLFVFSIYGNRIMIISKEEFGKFPSFSIL
jgi:hypothetical protein